MSEVKLTPAKLAELKKDAGNYKYAFVTSPATVLAMIEEIERLRIIESYYINGEIKQLESEAGQ